MSKLLLRRTFVATLCLVAIFVWTSGSAHAQTGSNLPQTRLVPISPSSPAPAFGPSLGPPSTFSSPPAFDPYAATPPSLGLGITPSGNGGGLFGNAFSQPASNGYSNAPILNAPAFTTPSGTFDNPSVYGPPAVYNPGGNFSGTTTQYPSSIYPQSSPTSLFPSGFMSNGPFINGGVDAQYSAFRLLHGLRLRHTLLTGGSGEDSLGVNSTDASVIFALPNFLYGTQPIYVIPSFSIHLFDGPESSSGADLPGSTYSAFLDFGYHSDPNRMIGTELGVRVGVFAEPGEFDSDALRVLGKGLINFRLTPASTVKFGVYYLDRVDWKLLPAGGILYQPDPYTRFDIFFPQPKFAKYWRTLGTQDFWGYVAGDYGGDSWAISRENGASDQFDLNELHALAGIEWGRSDQIRTGRRAAFAEIGYAFNREIKYRNNPSDIDVDDAFLFRLGIGY